VIKKTLTYRLDQDLRELPAYGITEAAHYLRIPQATLRSWVLGRFDPTQTGRKRFSPIIELPDRHRPLLSFMNLVEVHVLEAIRREHEISLPKIRTAINVLKKGFPSRHPLADQKFQTERASSCLSGQNQRGVSFPPPLEIRRKS